MVHTRATNSSPLVFDPEIERTASKARRALQFSGISIPMANEQPTLRQLNAPDLGNQNLAVTYPALGDGVNFELKSSLLHRLPSFHGLSGEDPNKHLAKFFNVCISMKPPNVPDDAIMMRAFPHSLKDEAEDWFYTLTDVLTWQDMKRLFLERYFPTAWLNNLKREIANVEQ